VTSNVSDGHLARLNSNVPDESDSLPIVELINCRDAKELAPRYGHLLQLLQGSFFGKSKHARQKKKYQKDVQTANFHHQLTNLRKGRLKPVFCAS
jgi:hypothetical protein